MIGQVRENGAPHPPEIRLQATAGQGVWFQQRRNFFVRQALEGFCRALVSFQDIYLAALSAGDQGAEEKAREAMWTWLFDMVGSENEHGSLWSLKDLCHCLWPSDGPELETNGRLVDWLIGSIFHEAMKLKENLYLLRSYAPAALRLCRDRAEEPIWGTRHDSAASRMALDMDVRHILHRLGTDVRPQVDHIGFLFGQACFIWRLMLPSLSGNTLVTRLLIEQEAMMSALWGETLEDLFDDMYDGRADLGFCVAGAGYLHGQWYEQALAAYQRTLDLHPGNDEAIIRKSHLLATLRINGDLLQGMNGRKRPPAAATIPGERRNPQT